MTDKILELDTNKFLFFDIETVARSPELKPDSKEYNLWRWKKRNQADNSLLSPKDTKDLYMKEAALHPAFNRIVCITLGYATDDLITIKSLVGEEIDIVKQFVEIANSSKKILCGFNILGFDLPVIRQKFVSYGLSDYLVRGNDVGKKPWILADEILDLMATWKGTYYTNQSLDEVAYMLDVPSPKDGIKGHEVSEAYYAGKQKLIQEYCERDVVSCIQILRRLQNKTLIQNVEVKNGKTK